MQPFEISKRTENALKICSQISDWELFFPREREEGKNVVGALLHDNSFLFQFVPTEDFGDKDFCLSFVGEFTGFSSLLKNPSWVINHELKCLTISELDDESNCGQFAFKKRESKFPYLDPNGKHFQDGYSTFNIEKSVLSKIHKSSQIMKVKRFLIRGEDGVVTIESFHHGTSSNPHHPTGQHQWREGKNNLRFKIGTYSDSVNFTQLLRAETLNRIPVDDYEVRVINQLLYWYSPENEFEFFVCSETGSKYGEPDNKGSK